MALSRFGFLLLNLSLLVSCDSNAELPGDEHDWSSTSASAKIDTKKIDGHFLYCPENAEMRAVDFDSACQSSATASPASTSDHQRQQQQQQQQPPATAASSVKYLLSRRTNSISGIAVRCKKTRHEVQTYQDLDRHLPTVTSYQASEHHFIHTNVTCNLHSKSDAVC